MARPRKPTKLLELNGAFKRNPKRARERQNEPVPARPLGDPPEYFSQAQRAAWFEIAEMVPSGVLMCSDRWLVEMSARMQVKMTEAALSASETTLWMRCMSQMGMTPSERSRIRVEKKQEGHNRFAEFAAGMPRRIK